MAKKQQTYKNPKSFEKQAIYIATQTLLYHIIQYRNTMSRADKIIFVRAMMDQCYGITNGISVINSNKDITSQEVKTIFNELISRFEYMKMTIRTLVNCKIFPENVSIILFDDISNIDENLKMWHKYKSDIANKKICQTLDEIKPHQITDKNIKEKTTSKTKTEKSDRDILETSVLSIFR